MDVLVVGVSHNDAPTDVRAQFAFATEGEALERDLAALRALPGVREGLIVSTCNRVELYAAGSAELDPAQLVDLLESHGHVPPGALDGFVRTRRGTDAVRHLFRVAASLDSMVVGEAQILGQVKEAYRHATAAGTCGPVLARAFERALSVAKRVRTETGIGSAAVSMGSAAVELARRIFGGLHDRTVLCVGAGKMGRLAALHLVGRGGVRRLLVCNRTPERAAQLAAELGPVAETLPYDRLGEALTTADIVVVSVAAPGYILGPEQLGPVMKKRRGNALFLVDLGVPRNVDPACARLNNVYLYDTDDIGKEAAAAAAERRERAGAAEGIVTSEAEAFARWMREQAVVPTIVALREKLHAIARAEVARTAPKLRASAPGLDPAALDALAAAVVNKILHEPTSRLRARDAAGDAATLAGALQTLFALDPGAPAAATPAHTPAASAADGATAVAASPAAHASTAARPPDAAAHDPAPGAPDSPQPSQERLR